VQLAAAEIIQREAGGQSGFLKRKRFGRDQPPRAGRDHRQAVALAGQGKGKRVVFDVRTQNAGKFFQNRRGGVLPCKAGRNVSVHEPPVAVGGLRLNPGGEAPGAGGRTDEMHRPGAPQQVPGQKRLIETARDQPAGTDRRAEAGGNGVKMEAAVPDDFVSFFSGFDAQSAHEKFPGKNLDTCLFVL